MTLTIISLCIFTAYIAYIVARYGVPASISESHYLLPRPWKWLFTAFCWGVALTIAVPWFALTPDAWQPLPFISIGGLLFVGGSPLFLEKQQRMIHYISAGACMLCSQLWIIGWAGMWPVSACFFSAFGLAALHDRQRAVFWVELAAFLSLFATIVTHNI